MNFKHRKKGLFFFFPLIALALLLAFGGIVMLLWNAILPDLLGIQFITYWQAVGLLLLCRILFGNFGKGRPGAGTPPQWKGRSQWREKWMNMTPEERERMKEEWRERCRRRKG